MFWINVSEPTRGRAAARRGGRAAKKAEEEATEEGGEEEAMEEEGELSNSRFCSCSYDFGPEGLRSPSVICVAVRQQHDKLL